MTTKAFDLARLIPDEAAVVGSTIVVGSTSPALDMNWAAMTSGGAFVPAATAQNQALVSGAGPGFAWTATAAILEAPLDGAVYGRVSAGWAKALPLAGGVMTGVLTLIPGTPSSASQAAPKSYVDLGDGASVTAANSYTDTEIAAANLDCGTY